MSKYDNQTVIPIEIFMALAEKHLCHGHINITRHAISRIDDN